MNEVVKFMETLQKDPSVKEMVKDIEIPEEEEKIIDLYVELGKKLGYSFTRDDLLARQQEMEKEYQARAEKAEDSMVKVLNQGQMEMVAGGRNQSTICKDTYYYSEWCWFTDWCMHVIKTYD